MQTMSANNQNIHLLFDFNLYRLTVELYPTVKPIIKSKFNLIVFQNLLT